MQSVPPTPSTLLITGLMLLMGSGCAQQPDKKALRIHKKVLTVDTHCDTPMRLTRGGFDLGQRHEPGQRSSGKMDFPRMKEGGLDAEFFAIFLGQGPLSQDGFTKAYDLAERTIDSMYAACERYPKLAEIATAPADAYRLEKKGKIAAFLGMENGYPLSNNLSLVKHFYDRGIRYITLCHTSNNQICDSSTDEKELWHGLSPFGEKVVKEMNRLGIMVDVSHISDKSFFDVIKLSNAPIIASHSSVRALRDSPRNLSDEMLMALKKNGGVIQICVFNNYLVEVKQDPRRNAALDSLRQHYGDYNAIKDEKVKEEMRNAYMALMEKYPGTRATVSDLVDHIDHVVNLIGIDHVGIGTDFDGGGGIDGCNDVTEFPNITRELVKRGYSEEDISKIWGGNFMRVFRKVQELAEQGNA